MIIYKKNGMRQKPVKLTLPIAKALQNKILNTGKLFGSMTGMDNIEVEVETDLGKQKMAIRYHSINQWVTDRNVVPETGEVLMDMLNESRAIFKQKKIDERRESLMNDVEREFKRTMNLKTSQVRRVRMPITKTSEQGREITVGYKEIPVVDEQDRPIRIENPKILAVKMDTAKFIAERLKPEIYGKVDQSVNKHLVFSLADLRRSKREMSENEELQGDLRQAKN